MQQSKADYAGQLTNKDVNAIRQRVATARFLHWPRIAMEFGLTVERLKVIADTSAKQ